ncbi:MAG: hypothetical protein Q9162_007903 [Coniocarpon cinnabarinum]
MSKPAALVTGGASGIGLAVTKHLLGRGYRVGIFDLNKDLGEAEAGKLGQDCLFLCVDIADYSQQAKAFKRVYEWAENRLDVFVANAGIPDTDAIYKEGDVDDEGLPKPLNLKVLDVNLDAILQGVRLFTHFARKRPESEDLPVQTTDYEISPNYSIPLYAASKHGLVGFVRSAAPVLAFENITLNAICPVLINTGIMPAEARHLWDPQQLTPMSTAMKAYDAILDSDKINGQTIELSLDDIIFKQQPEYSSDNVRWMFDETQMGHWETATAAWMPRAPGRNVKKMS